MRLCARLARAEFALLAGPRATCGATYSLYLLESRLLGLHTDLDVATPSAKKWSILHRNSNYWGFTESSRFEQARTDAEFLEWVRIAYTLGIKPSKLAEAQEEIEKNLSHEKTGSDS